MFNGAYGSRLGIASVLSIIYIGVVVSDMVSNSVPDLHPSCWVISLRGIFIGGIALHVGEGLTAVLTQVAHHSLSLAVRQ